MVKKSARPPFSISCVLLLTTASLTGMPGVQAQGRWEALNTNLVGRWAARQAPSPGAQGKPVELQVAKAPIPTRVLVQSPAETVTELQIICLFESAPENTLHGSLVEANDKLKGLLERIRKPELFRGELSETILLIPPGGTFGARKLLIIGLGDSQTFTPLRMELVGTVAYRESNRLGTAHPFFAPTVLDGGVTKFTTGEVAERFYSGFLRASRTEKILADAGTSAGQIVKDLTFLAGPTHAADTLQGLERALANPQIE